MAGNASIGRTSGAEAPNSINALSLIGLGVVMTTVAEIFYFVVWGILLFPEGNLTGKAIWTMTCGIAMGVLIGASVLLWVENRKFGRTAIGSAALVFAGVCSYCAWLCAQIDTKFNYFGGAEHSFFFLASGIIPAIAGGLIFGWLLYGESAKGFRERIGLRHPPVLEKLET